MKRLVVMVVTVMMIGLMPRLASAQAKQGDSEVLIGGNLFSIMGTGSTITTGQFQFGYGYFLTDRFEINITPVVTVTASPSFDPRTGQQSGNDVTADAGAGFGVQYFFGSASSKVKPYVGGSAVMQSFKTRDTFDPVTFRQVSGSLADNLYTGGTVGVKNYFTDKAALDFKASYGFNPRHASDQQLLQVLVGITYLF